MNQNRQDIDEHLLLQYLLGNADEDLTLTVQSWLNAAGGNRKHLDQLESLWLETGKLTPVPVSVDVEAAWQRMSERISQDDIPDRKIAGKEKVIGLTSYRFLLSVAAFVVLLIGIYSIYRMVTNTAKPVELASENRVICDTLPDKSVVTLNKNSKLIYPETFNTENRDVELTGEAFFEVKKDSAHPFVISAGPFGIKVLGTAFSVKTTPENSGIRVEVDVTEGRVMLYRLSLGPEDTSSLILGTGESGTWDSGKAEPDSSLSKPPDGLYWANRSLNFRSNPLSEVFTLLEKYYSIKITTSNPAIMNCRLTASFENEPAHRILTVIAESFSLELQADGNNFHLAGDGCSK